MKTERFKRTLALVLMALLVLSSVGCSNGSTIQPQPEDEGNSQPEQPETVKMRLATSVQPDHIMNLSALEFARLVEEKSEGRMVIDVYPSRQLGQDNEVAEMVMQGSLDFVEISSIIFSNYTDLANTWQLPFVFSNYEQWRNTVKSEANQAILDGITELDLGIKALQVYTASFRHLIVKGDPIKSIDDMKNLKIRTGESTMFLEAFRAIGAAPTPMSFGEVYSGLQNKVIDACESDYGGITTEKYYEVTSSLTESKHFVWPGLLAINQERFDSLSAEDQEIIIKAANEVIDYNVELMYTDDENRKEFLIEEGFALYELPEEEVQRFKDAVAPVVKKYTEIDSRISDFVDEANRNI